MTTISAKTILRSRNAARPDKVLSTLLLRYPRWIHAEQRTHRVIPLDEGLSFEVPTPSLMADTNLSRNAASSRAIPVSKLIQDVMDDPADPLWWGKNQPGMQAFKELSGQALLDAQEAWREARLNALDAAHVLAAIGAHKQIVNRLLEPFSHITVLVSSTEWENFLELRDHADAEPHIAMLAREIRKCLEREDDIQTLQPGQWHLPFVTEEDWAEADAFGRHLSNVFPNPDEPRTADDIAMDNLRKLSTARCASTSYKTVDGFDMTLDRAIALHDKLVAADPIHASPAEHVAQADDVAAAPWGDTSGKTFWENSEQHGNFDGFRQYRHMLGGRASDHKQPQGVTASL